MVTHFVGTSLYLVLSLLYIHAHCTQRKTYYLLDHFHLALCFHIYYVCPEFWTVNYNYCFIPNNYFH